jgi:hypothetical protein
MWYGSPSTIPLGWQLCDGGYGTPNLRDRFIVGAGRSLNLGDNRITNSNYDSASAIGYYALYYIMKVGKGIDIVVPNFVLNYPTVCTSPITGGSYFTWSVTGGYPGETWYATTDAPNTPRVPPISGVAYLGVNGSATFTDGDFGNDLGPITVTFHFSQSGTYTRTITNIAPFTLTYPTTCSSPSLGGSYFTWSVRGGKPNETWYATTTAPNTPYVSGTLDAHGSATYTNGDFGNFVGDITVTFYFSQSGTYTKTITSISNLSTFVLTYPSTAKSPSRGGTYFTWSVTGGKPNESWYATTTAPDLPSISGFSLDSSGAATYTNGDFGPNTTGLVTVTFYFSQSGTYTRTILLQ